MPLVISDMLKKLETCELSSSDFSTQSFTKGTVFLAVFIVISTKTKKVTQYRRFISSYSCYYHTTITTTQCIRCFSAHTHAPLKGGVLPFLIYADDGSSSSTSAPITTTTPTTITTTPTTASTTTTP